MRNKIQTQSAVCDVLNTFVTAHPEALDAAGTNELLAVKDDVEQILETIGGSRDAVAEARAKRVNSFASLQKATVECRKTFEIYVVRGGKVDVPEYNGALWLPSQITELATRYLDAARNIDDPAVNASAAALQNAFDGFRAARSETSRKIGSTRTFKKGLKAEVEEIGGKLEGYANIIAYHVSPELRRELFYRLRVARQPKPSRHEEQANGAATAAGTSDAAKALSDKQPTAIPALPTIPGVTTTVVPPSGELPKLSANA